MHHTATHQQNQRRIMINPLMNGPPQPCGQTRERKIPQYARYPSMGMGPSTGALEQRLQALCQHAPQFGSAHLIEAYSKLCWFFVVMVQLASGAISRTVGK
jgi:hypothetical protein